VGRRSDYPNVRTRRTEAISFPAECSTPFIRTRAADGPPPPTGVRVMVCGPRGCVLNLSSGQSPHFRNGRTVPHCKTLGGDIPGHVPGVVPVARDELSRYHWPKEMCRPIQHPQPRSGSTIPPTKEPRPAPRGLTAPFVSGKAHGDFSANEIPPPKHPPVSTTSCVLGFLPNTTSPVPPP
jgi:hypothetical protein